MEELDPYEAFEIWARANGFADLIDCEVEDVNLERLNESIEAYANS